MLAVNNVRIYCFVHHLESSEIVAENELVGNKGWRAEELERGESETIICNYAEMPTLPKSADIGIVVDYRALGVPFKTFRRIFRFVGEYGNTWQWLPQPSEKIRKDVDAQIGHWTTRVRSTN